MTTATSTASTAFVSTSLRYIIFLLFVSLVGQTQANTDVNVWRSRSIYQVITDRFARTDGSTTAECVLPDNKICGGTWQGIINKLDYIQGMGFTAVSSDCLLRRRDRVHGSVERLQSHYMSLWEFRRLSMLGWKYSPAITGQ